MPNWCYNNLTFTGDSKNIDVLSKLLDKTKDIQDKTGYGQILHSLEGSIDGYMFDISNFDVYERSNNTSSLNFTFDSRWSPIPNDMVRIAELLNLRFVYNYEESGMALYGQYKFNGEYLSEKYLTEEEIEKCRIKHEDDEEDEYTGLDYDKLYDMIETSNDQLVEIKKINQEA